MGNIAQQFADHGFVFPVDVFDRQEALSFRHELEGLEQRVGDRTLGNKDQLNYPHVIFRFAHQIACHTGILDAVEAILGRDILLWGSTFFIKEPHTEGFVSWHQDLRYWGLDSDAQVSAWLALSPVSEANGCMRFVPGSHRGELLPHVDTFDDDNVLTRGQEAVVAIDDAETICVPLQPGQASFHHGKLLHSSGPNHSAERRIGFAINYIAPHVRQVVASEDFAMLVRGEDRYGNFRLVPPPDEDLSGDAMRWHGKILAAQNKAMYASA
jgi:ectoine hydroxylase-related dioxygenase (phytanoyl-CoA dioxygenase family)